MTSAPRFDTTEEDAAVRRARALREVGKRADWWYLVVMLGLAAMLAGVVVLVEPGTTLRLIGIWAGVYLIVLACVGLAEAFTIEGIGGVDLVLDVVLWAVALGVGVFMAVRPVAGVAAIVIVLSTYLLVAGTLSLIGAVRSRDARAWNVVRGVLDLAAGVVVVAWPDIGLAALAVVLGIYLLLTGALQVALGFGLRQIAKSPPDLPRRQSE